MTNSKTFDEILQDYIKLRRETKAVIKDTLTAEDLEEKHRLLHIENTFLKNHLFGRFGSKDNVLSR